MCRPKYLSDAPHKFEQSTHLCTQPQIYPIKFNDIGYKLYTKYMIQLIMGYFQQMIHQLMSKYVIIATKHIWFLCRKSLSLISDHFSKLSTPLTHPEYTLQFSRSIISPDPVH